MNKEFRKAIYTRTRLKNKFLKNSLEQNELLFKKQRNTYVSIRRKSIKNHLNNITEKEMTANKDFQNFVKPLLTNKGFINSTDITLKLDNKVITEETKLVESFNNHYINIVEQSSGLKPAALGQKGLGDKAEICSIIESYKNHPSIKQMSNKLKLLENEENFCFKMITTKYIKSFLQKVNTEKATGIDSIPPKLVKLAAEPLSQPLFSSYKHAHKTKQFSKQC